jgi:hypothetical protein
VAAPGVLRRIALRRFAALTPALDDELAVAQDLADESF